MILQDKSQFRCMFCGVVIKPKFKWVNLLFRRRSVSPCYCSKECEDKQLEWWNNFTKEDI